MYDTVTVADLATAHRPFAHTTTVGAFALTPDRLRATQGAERVLHGNARSAKAAAIVDTAPLFTLIVVARGWGWSWNIAGAAVGLIVVAAVTLRDTRIVRQHTGLIRPTLSGLCPGISWFWYIEFGLSQWSQGRHDAYSRQHTDQEFSHYSPR
jgi:hypothetical protein